MKKFQLLSKILVLGLLASLFYACSADSVPYGEEVAEGYQINVSDNQKHLQFDLERSSSVQVLAGNGMRWTAKTNDSWIRLGNDGRSTCSGTGPSTFTVSVTGDNPSESKRTGTIYLNSERFNHQTSIMVEQAGGYITAPLSVEFPAMSDQRTITITSNVSWNVQMYGNTSIDTATPQKGMPGTTTVTLKSKNNTKAEDDSQYIFIVPGDSGGISNVPTKAIEIIREKVTLQVLRDDNTYWFEKTGGSFVINVISNSAWRITNLPNWLKASVSSGTKDKSVTITVSNNTGLSRDWTFNVVSGEVEVSLWVGQDGMPTPGEGDNITPRYIRKR